MTNNPGGPLAGESTAGWAARARALRAYADAKRRVIGRTASLSDPAAQSIRLQRTGRRFKRLGQ